MKKVVFCIVLSVCLMVSAVAFSENNGFDTSVFNVGYSYTKTAEYGAFTVHIPSVFRSLNSALSDGSFATDECHISISSYKYEQWITGLDVENPKQAFDYFQSFYAELGLDFEAMQINGCPVLFKVYFDNGYIWGENKEGIHTVSKTYITDGETVLIIDINSVNTELVKEFTEGIILHLSVPEVKS